MSIEGLIDLVEMEAKRSSTSEVERIERVLADFTLADQILAHHLGPKTKVRLELAAARERFIERTGCLDYSDS